MPGQYIEQEDPELLVTPTQEEAIEDLEEIAGTTPTLPTVTLPSYPTLPTLELPSIKLPGITAEEKKLLGYGMSMIEKLMSGKMPEAFTLGMDKIKSVLAGEYDPRVSPYYKGLKEEAAVFKEEGISDIRQRSQLGGMLYSEPAMGEERKLTGQIGTGLTKELGRLYEADIARQVGTIPALLAYSEQEVGMPGRALAGIGSLSPLAGKPGDITRQESLINYQTGITEAMFNIGQRSKETIGGFGVETGQALSDWEVGTQQTLFPWTYQAPILEGLAEGYGTWWSPELYYQPGLIDYLAPIGAAYAGK